MSLRSDELGRSGEDLAARYLHNLKMRIIARNFRDKTGEIDIIAQDGETVVFVEVKTRRSDRYGSPEESVTPSKQKQIIRVAGSFLSKHALIDAPIRFDVIAIRMATKGPEINHIVAAFDAS